jgi:hypothetical protein
MAAFGRRIAEAAVYHHALSSGIAVTVGRVEPPP